MRTSTVSIFLILATAIAAAGDGLTDAERARIDELLPMLRVTESDVDFSDPAALERLKNAKEAEQDLLTALGDRGEAWDHARPRLLAVPEDEAHRDVKARLLTILVHDPDPETLRRLAAHLEKDPSILDLNALVRLDERGVMQAGEILAARVKEHLDWPSLVYPAARLAMKGIDVGRPLLESIAAKPGMLRTMPDTWFAACASLSFLGDGSAWKEARKLAGAAIREAVKKEQLPWAKWLLLRVEYFDRAGAKKEPVGLAFMSDPVQRWSDEHDDGLDDARAILARLDRLLS